MGIAFLQFPVQSEVWQRCNVGFRVAFIRSLLASATTRLRKKQEEAEMT